MVDLVNSTVLFLIFITVPTFKELINLFTAMTTVMNANEPFIHDNK